MTSSSKWSFLASATELASTVMRRMTLVARIKLMSDMAALEIEPRSRGFRTNRFLLPYNVYVKGSKTPWLLGAQCSP